MAVKELVIPISSAWQSRVCWARRAAGDSMQSVRATTGIPMEAQNRAVETVSLP